MSRKTTVRATFSRTTSEQHEHVGDHDGGEQLEEVLHPQVHDPEAPELVDGEVLARLRDQADRVERGIASAAMKNSHGMFAGCSARSRVRRTRQSMNTHTKSPIESSTCQTRARSRYSKPWSRTSWRRRRRAGRARRGRSRSACRTPPPPARRATGRRACPAARLAPRDHRGEEDAGGHERCRDPEDRQLHVPGAHQVEGQQLGQVDPEEARQLGPVVL